MIRSLGMALFVLLALSFCSPSPTPAQQPSRQQQLEKLRQLRERIDVLDEAKQYAEVIPVALEVARICRDVHGAAHDDTATALNNLGYYYRKVKDYDSAQPPFELALEIRRKILGETHARTILSYDALIALLHLKHQYAAAQSYQERVLASHKRIARRETTRIASETRYLGQLVNEQGKYTEARDLYYQSMMMYQRLLGANHVEVAISRNNLGLAYYELGDFATAQAHLEKVLPVFQREYGEEHESTASAYQSIGYLKNYLGDPQGARPYYERALAIRRKVLGEKHIGTAHSFHNMAIFIDEHGDSKEALPYYEQALAIFEAELGADDPKTLKCLSVLGTCHRELGNFAAAQECVERALAAQLRVLGEDHPETALTLVRLASLFREQEDYDTARRYNERAIATTNRTFGEHHPNMVYQLYYLAVTEAFAEQWPAALQRMEAMQQGQYHHIRQVLVGLSAAEQLTFLADNQFRWDAGYSLGHARKDDQAFVDASAGWLINSKGLAQEVLAARQLLSRDLNDAQANKIAAQLRETRQQMAKLAISVPDQKDINARKQSLDKLTQQEQQLSRQLVERLGTATTTGQWTGLDAIRAAIPEGEIFINFARFDICHFQTPEAGVARDDLIYCAWIIPPAGLGKVQLVDLGSATEIDALIEQVRKTIDEAGKTDGAIRKEGEELAEQKLREAFQPLHERIWQPLAKHLPEDTKRLILSPDGALWLLPWNAIPLEGNRFLVEDFSLRYVISGRELVGDHPQTDSATSLLFADPAYDLSPEKTRAAVQAIFKDIKFDENATRSLSKTSLGRVTPLPNTRLEALAITPSVEQITGKSPISYLGSYALESVVKRVERPSILVISTHGYFLPDEQKKSEKTEENQPIVGGDLRARPAAPIENPLLRCGLMLAGCNQPAASGEDGVLTGMEIVGLDLRGTKLVVLSACQTGVGKVQLGEGVAGLRQAFQLAGANGVVSTLWHVPDRDSAILMKDLFENLANEQGQAESLRNAQLSRIASRRERNGAAHPFFWAAWTLTGRE